MNDSNRKSHSNSNENNNSNRKRHSNSNENNNNNSNSYSKIVAVEAVKLVAVVADVVRRL